METFIHFILDIHPGRAPLSTHYSFHPDVSDEEPIISDDRLL